MRVEAISIAGNAAPEIPKSQLDKLSEERKKKEAGDQEPKVEVNATLSPEEFIKQVKGLTEDGQYSVRFETDDLVNELVVKVVDRDTDEVIRQIPAEELLGIKAALNDLRGQFIDTEG